MRKQYLVLLCFVIMGASCKNSSGKPKILPVDSVKMIMWDLLKADELYLRIKIKDSTAEKRKENIRMFEEVYAIHHITKGQFDSSFKYYESHPIIFKQLIDSLDAFASREKMKLSDRHGQAQPAPTKDSSALPFKSVKLK